MNPTKMKIILAVSVAVNVALIAVMLQLKSGYEEQAQASYKAATTSYTESVKSVLNAQNAYIQGSNAIWQIAFETTSQKLSKAAFDARVAALDSAKTLNPQTNGDVTTLSCGDGCSVPFTFKNGQFASFDAQALSQPTSQKFQIQSPAPFQFNAK